MEKLYSSKTCLKIAGGVYIPHIPPPWIRSWPHYLMQHAYQAHRYCIDTAALYSLILLSFGWDILNQSFEPRSFVAFS